MAIIYLFLFFRLAVLFQIVCFGPLVEAWAGLHGSSICLLLACRNEINVNGQMHGVGYVPLWHRLREECRLFSCDILHGNVFEAGGIDAIT